MQKKHPPSFEDGLQRLQDIVSTLEEGKLPLEATIKLYKEGIALSKICRSHLEQAQHEVKILTEEGTFEPFDFSPLENIEDSE